MPRKHISQLLLALCGVAFMPPLALAQQANHVAGDLIQLNDNGAWSWFMDDRAIVADGKLVVGSVRSVGAFDNAKDPDWGNIEIAVYDLAAGKAQHTVLHRHLEQDDHNNPGLLALPDKRILAMYTKHGHERKIYCRISEPGDPLRWGEVQEFVPPGQDHWSDHATYNNLFRLENGRIYDFFRGFGREPNYLVSDDNGRTWSYGGKLLAGKSVPYLRYAFDGKHTIHFIATDDHPRHYDNSVYHGFLRDEQLHQSDGKAIAPLSKTTDAKVNAWDFTRVFAGDADHVSWIDDVRLDHEQKPCVIFSTKRDGRGTKGNGGMDIRFHYGRWDGKAWQTHEMAYAGTRLYALEADYTGLAVMDRHRPNVVYMSTNADPASGKPLVSAADNKRHHELFRGTTADGGKSWRWEPLTANSTVDNLRPIVPPWQDERTALVWMRGTYRTMHEWTTAVVAMILPPPK